ncbi:MAG TPA: hypothetical protein PKY46_14320, partial [Ignavibacteriaceae bacterium]|nr:hypothetical protein [Ignavibacteriaceae bacterium]
MKHSFHSIINHYTILRRVFRALLLGTLFLLVSAEGWGQLDGTIAKDTIVCQNAVSPELIFTGIGGTEPYTFYYNVNSESVDSVKTTTGNTCTLSVSTLVPGTYLFTLDSLRDGNNSWAYFTEQGVTVTVNALPGAPLVTTPVLY